MTTKYLPGQTVYRVRRDPAMPDLMVQEHTIASPLREQYQTEQRYVTTTGETIPEWDSYPSREVAVAKLQCLLIEEEAKARTALRQIATVRERLRQRGEWPPVEDEPETVNT